MVDVAAFLAFRCVHLFTQTTLQRLTGTHDIVAKELSVSGVSLVKEILGFDHVIIIDSYTGKDTEAGRIRKSTPTDFMDTIHPETPHGLNFSTALEFYWNPDSERIPKCIEIYTIDIDSNTVFVTDSLPP